MLEERMFFKYRNIFILNSIPFIILIIVFIFSCRSKILEIEREQGNDVQNNNVKMGKIKSPIEAKFVEINKPEIGKTLELLLKIKLDVDCEDVNVKFKYPSQIEDSKTKKELSFSLNKNSEVSISQSFFIPDDKRYIIDAFIQCKMEGNTVLSKSIPYIIDLGEKEEVDREVKTMESTDGEKLNVHFVK